MLNATQSVTSVGKLAVRLQIAHSFLKATTSYQKKSPEKYHGVAKTKFRRGLPSTPGVYERDMTGTGEVCEYSFSFFDGEVWYLGWETPDLAISARTVTVHQDLPWRGLATQL